MKLFWYIISFLSILLILSSSPISNNTNIFANQNKFLSFNSNQILIQKIIFIHVLLFFIITTVCSM